MVLTQMKPEDTTMRRRITTWKEPKRRPSEGPTLTARAVADLLGFTSTESIQILVRRGPENDGLPGYIPASSGTGWIRKNLPHLTDEEMRERRQLLSSLAKEEIARLRREGDNRIKKILYETHSGTQIMFYRDDVEEWAKKHPVLAEQRAKVEYSQDEHDLVMSEYDKLKNPDGSVYRSKLYNHLQRKYGIHTWNTRTYRKLKQILDDEGIKLPPEMKHSTSARRRYRAV
jgi:hypothetical protein